MAANKNLITLALPDSEKISLSMEKVGALIKRLQQQYTDKADESSLLNTALLLVTELQQNNQAGNKAHAGKVSVIMPFKPFEVTLEESNKNEQNQNVQVEENTAVQPAEDQNLQQVKEEIILPQTIEPEPVQTSSVNTLAEEKYNDVMEHIPTLAQQQPKVVYELNDTAQTNERSINDTLKPQATEAGSRLKEEPIKDLRKAIGINDKYLFIKELFRNDEVAYERSIKTINSFHILPEAEYWIQREMIYKLGWDDNNPTVKAFYQLVRRRFS